MTTREMIEMLEEDLAGFRDDLEAIEANDEETVCLMFNFDSKAEAIATIKGDIERLERSLEKYQEELEWTEEDAWELYCERVNLCISQGLCAHIK